MKRSASVLVLAAPSGVGKTTLARTLVGKHADFVFALSATTRPPRRDERDGYDYRFVDDAGFDALLASGHLLEWADVHGYRYGTLRSGVEATLAAGRTAVLDIDVQGARQIRATFPDAILVFILPPSAAELVRRIEGRASETPPEKLHRMRTAVGELAAVHEFDHVIVNDDLASTIGVLRVIVTGEDHHASGPAGMKEPVEKLKAELTHWIEARKRDESIHT